MKIYDNYKVVVTNIIKALNYEELGNFSCIDSISKFINDKFLRF